MTKTANTPKARCLGCRRKLTAPASIARGRGRTCQARVNTAAKIVDLSAFKDAKAVHAKAIELIEQGGIVPTRHHGQYLAVASDGLNTYLVETVGERSCTCKAGQRLGRCYHLVAADILNAAAPARHAA